MNSLRHETGWESDGTQGAGETQGARRATEVSSAPRPTVRAAGLRAVDPEVGPKAQRRRFSPTYKLRIVQEAAACKQPGEVAALLRREGLYASSLTKWRLLHKQGALAGLGAARGRKPDPETQQRQRIRELERENQHLRGKLRQAEVIIEVQKKVSEILGIQLAPSDEAGERI